MIFERLVVNYYKKALLPRRDPDGALYYFSKRTSPSYPRISISSRVTRVSALPPSSTIRVRKGTISS